MKTILSILLSIPFMGLASTKFQVSKLTTVHAQRYPVIDQTEVKIVEPSVLKRFYIAKLSPSAYEYGAVFYKCVSSQCKRTHAPLVLATYRICYGFNKNGIPNCRGPYNLEPLPESKPDELSPKDRMHLDDDSNYEEPDSE